MKHGVGRLLVSLAITTLVVVLTPVTELCSRLYDGTLLSYLYIAGVWVAVVGASYWLAGFRILGGENV